MSKATRLALTGLVAALFTAAPATAAYDPPLGIPAPPFGIDESVASVYGDGDTYTHYIDNTDPNATDTSNLYGTPDKPRLTIPQTLAAGSVVQVHGGPYTYGALTGGLYMTRWNGSGTSVNPVFIRGTDPNNMPVFRQMQLRLKGTYLIVENLEMDNCAPLISYDPGDSNGQHHHIAIRGCEVYGRPPSYGTAVSAGRGHYIVIYNNYIHDNGDPNYFDENDLHGVYAGQWAYKIWILNNHSHGNGGDSVQINSGGVPENEQANCIYIGGNEYHADGENAVDLKKCRNVIISENEFYDYKPTEFAHSGSDGTAMVVHYDPNNVWIMHNKIHNSTNGVRINGCLTSYVVNNLIYDIHHDPNSAYDPYSVWGLSAGLIAWANSVMHIVGNTMYDVDAGILSPGGGLQAYHISNNIIAELAEPAYHIAIAVTGVCAASEIPYNCLYDSDDGVRIRWGGTTYTSLSSFESAYPGKSTGCIDTDPLLIDPDNGNFSIADTSPAADAGTGQTYEDYYDDFDDLDGLDIGEDYDGNIRPQGVGYAMGAYEVAGTVGNAAPNVNAGNDDVITLPNYVTLDGTVSDDGLPDPPASVTTTWSKDSGPGNVTFGDSSTVDTTAGFSVEGTYVLKLEASDGDQSNSDTVTITVNAQATNQTPTVNAGSDDTVTLPSYATLDGTVNDDGLPDPPGSVTTTWSKDSGPGTVTFGDASAVDTTAGFSVEGTYVLKLEASDSLLSDEDTVQITVNAQASNQAPTVNAGNDDSVTLPNYAWLDGTINDDGLPDPPGAVTSTWSKVSGPGTVTFASSSAVDTTAGFSEAGTYVLKLEASDSVLSDDDTVQIAVSEQGTGDGGSGPFQEEDGTVVMEAENYDDNLTRSDPDSDNWSEDTSYSGYVGNGYMQAPDLYKPAWSDAAELGYDIDFTNAGTYTIWARLYAVDSGSDSVFCGMDGTQTGASYMYPGGFNQWVWANYYVDVYVSAGEHTFQLRRREKLLCADRIILTTNLSYTPSGNGPAESSRGGAGNAAPTANAGSDDSITLPSTASLDGTVSDDGLPDPPGAVTTTWSKASGPGTVTFGDSSAVDTTAGFSENGVYVLQLSVSDGDLSDSDQVQITVDHVAPTANAGADDEISLPNNATLDGTVSDDGFPLSPGSVTTTWTKSSGAGTVTFGDSAAVDTTAGFSEAGTYVLQLAAFDGDKSDTDTVQIIVNVSGSGAFQESDGQVVMEAENYDDNLTRSDPDNDNWSEDTSYSGYVGNGYMQAPDLEKPTWSDGAELGYDIDFTNAGTYTIWARLYADTSGNDSVFCGMDGTQIGASYMYPSGYGQWLWANYYVDVYVSAGEHTFQLRRRERLLCADRIILTTDTNYTPSGNGPPESPRGSNEVPTADAGADDSITLPAGASLDGTVSDDGLPDPPGAVTTTWSKVSGPATVTFTDASAVDTTATFSDIGTYVLKLQITDGASTDEDTVQIVADHLAPTVDAGTNETITLPDGVTLDGTVSDDGYPADPGILTTTWTQESGPGTATFGDISAVDTTASFTEDGLYTLQLVADDGDVVIMSNTVTITVNHVAPTADAGADDSITLPDYASLDGTVSDDGFPLSPGAVSVEWTEISGPGTVTFGDIAAIDTTAGFSENGVYVLRLEASDGDLTDSDTVQITVNHVAPTADAGSDDECTLPSGVTLDGTVSDDGFPLSPGSLTTTWTKQSGPGTVTFGDSSAVDTTASFSEAGTYTLRLTADDGDKTDYDDVTITVTSQNNAPTADAGSDDECTLPSGVTLDGTVSDDGYPLSPGAVTTTWSKDSGPGTVTFGDSSAVDTTAGFSENGVYVLQLEASDGDLSDSDTVQITVDHVGPTANAGSDDSITLPSNATLDGTVSDDGFPLSPGAVTTTWTKQSGPGTVTFGDSSAVDTTAGFSEAGTYTLRLTADDGDKTDYDDVTITVNPANSAPTANAGSDDSITLPNYATLDGTVSDDGLPDPPASLTTTWSKDSGPGTVTFGDSSAVDTTAGFSENGVYVLQLEASDGDLSDSDTVQITVNHLAPTADAGSDDECTLPDGVTLDGTVSDDGFPLSPGAVTTTWSKDSGPGTVTFGDSSAVDTTAGFSEAGTYVLRLTATDGDKNDYDDMTIAVNAAPSGSGPFQEEGGTVVMEAENYDDNLTRSDPDNDNWSEDTSYSGYVGNGYMQAPDLLGGLWSNGAELGYDIDFTNAGTYTIWLRLYADTSGNDSVFVGMDDTQIGPYYMSPGGYDQWLWDNYYVDVYVSTGEHTFQLRRRERLLCADRIILTTDMSYTASGDGPAESSRQ